jgi:pyruvate/2-oxoglutarate dehydrogenase complex dihydrolipoamide dehydrogenase (E3) component
MKFEYDLVVVGSTDEAIYAAKKAVELKARVALVRHDLVWKNRNSELIYRRTYNRFTSLFARVKEYPFAWENESKSYLENGILWGKEVRKGLSEGRSSAVLGALGIDVIDGEGEFFHLPELGMRVNGRELKARSYLIAAGSVENIPQIEGLERVVYLDCSSLWQQNLALMPGNLLVISNDEKGLEIAQILVRLGKQVILVTEQTMLLPAEDEELVRLLQANLEAEGIIIYTSTKIGQVKSIENKKWLQLGDEAIAVDELIIVGKSHPNIQGLNLEGIEIKYDDRGIEVDRTLQTNNSQVYAAGDILGGYNCDRLARYEVDIALQNALASFKLFSAKTNYNRIPIVIFTDPILARVGMTEIQAKQKCSENIQVIRQYLPKSITEQIDDRSPTFCKLILRNNGEILGAHLLGYRAVELIETIALAIEHKINFSKDIIPFD